MIVMALLSHLKRSIALAIWVIVNEVLFIAVLPLIRKMVASTRDFLAAMAVLVFFAPLYLEIYMGNATFMAASLMIIGLYFFRQDKLNRFYFLYLASLFIKPIGLLFIPILLARRHYKQVILVLTIFLGPALSYFAAYPDQWDKFLSVNMPGGAVQAGFLVHGGHQGFYTLYLRVMAFLSDVHTADLYSLSQLSWVGEWTVRAIPFIFVVVSLWATCRLRNNSPYLLFFLWSATYLLGYKDVWEHSYSFLIFGLLCLYLSDRIGKKTLLVFSIYSALPTAFAFYDLTIISHGFNDPDWFWDFPTSMLHHALRPAGLLALYLIAIWSVRATRKAATEATAATSVET
jgi:hypothetical protein